MMPQVKQDNSVNGRIGYIDALKGFTIFLVVFNHVSIFYLQVPVDAISFHYYFIQLQMPMFFLLSGFFSYNAGEMWNVGSVFNRLKKRVPRLLIAPFLFLVVLCYVKGIGLNNALLNPLKQGYWFTFILFGYYLLYVIIRLCTRSDKWAGVVAIVLGIVLFPTSWVEYYLRIPVPEHILGLLSVFFWGSFIYFVLGVLLKRHFDQALACLHGKWLLPLCILSYIFINVFYKDIPVGDMYKELPLVLSGLVVFFGFFEKKQELFSNQHRLGRVLQYMGRRTLDIYLIHFFMIPLDFKIITVFMDHSMPVIEAFVAAVIAVLIIAVSLLVSEILRLSPFLAHWLFGAKKA